MGEEREPVSSAPAFGTSESDLDCTPETFQGLAEVQFDDRSISEAGQLIHPNCDSLLGVAFRKFFRKTSARTDAQRPP